MANDDKTAVEQAKADLAKSGWARRFAREDKLYRELEECHIALAGAIDQAGGMIKVDRQYLIRSGSETIEFFLAGDGSLELTLRKPKG